MSNGCFDLVRLLCCSSKTTLPKTRQFGTLLISMYTDIFLELILCDIYSAQLGLAFLHLALEGSSPEIRQATQTAVAAFTARLPQLTSCVIRDAVNAFLSRGPPASKAAASTDEQHKPWNKHARLSAILLSAVSFEADLDLTTREDMIVELVILGHHHLVCMFLSIFYVTYANSYFFACAGGTSRQTWIDLCQKARTDPHDLTNRHLDKLFKLILGASTVDSKVSRSRLVVHLPLLIKVILYSMALLTRVLVQSVLWRSWRRPLFCRGL